MNQQLKTKALDVAERTGATFAEAFVGGLILAPSLNITTVHAAITAGVIAALAYTKSTLALFVGSNTVSPASLVPAPTPALPPSNQLDAAPMPQTQLPDPNYGTMSVGGVLITILPAKTPGGIPQ